MNLIQKINELFPNKPNNRHSFFQLQYFVVGKQPTIQAKIRTCKIELLSRKSEIEAVVVSIDDLLDRIKLEEMEIECISGNCETGQIEIRPHERNKKVPQHQMTEYNKIDSRQHERKKLALEHQIDELKATLTAKEEECVFLIGLYERLIQIEPEKDWDSMEVQTEYWNAKLTREIESRLMLGELPNIEDFKTVLSLPDGIPIKDATLKLIHDRQQAYKKQEKLINE